MRHVASLYSLQDLGVIPLTGESDALSFRILCDLTLAGKAMFCEALGLPLNVQLAEPWNSGTPGTPHEHVASVLLTNDMVIPLGIVGLLQQGCHSVIYTLEEQVSRNLNIGGQNLYGLSEGETYRRAEYEEYTDEHGHLQFRITRPFQINLRHTEDWSEWQAWPTCYGEVQRVFERPNTASFRNRHAMSGRVD